MDTGRFRDRIRVRARLLFPFRVSSRYWVGARVRVRIMISVVLKVVLRLC